MGPIRSIVAVLGGILLISVVVEVLEFTLVNARAGGVLTGMASYFAVRNRFHKRRPGPFGPGCPGGSDQPPLKLRRSAGPVRAGGPASQHWPVGSRRDPTVAKAERTRPTCEVMSAA